MIKRYVSKYTGEQIDEAVGALIENNITKEDLSPELQAELENGALEKGAGLNSAQTFEKDGKTTINFLDGSGNPKNAFACDLVEDLIDSEGNFPYGATNEGAVAVGGKASAQGKRSMAQGTTTIARGAYSHAEGDNSVAAGGDSHAEGYATTAFGKASHSEGNNTAAIGEASHSEGFQTFAVGEGAHTWGCRTVAQHPYQTACGYSNDNKTDTLFEIGNGDKEGTSRSNAFEAYKDGKIAVGKLETIQDPKYNGVFDFTGKNAKAVQLDASLDGIQPYGAEGGFTTAVGGNASAQGKRSMAQGTATIAKGSASHAEGDNSVAYGNDSHAEGYATTAYGVASHSEGNGTVAGGEISHAEGFNNIIGPTAVGAHVEGAHNVVKGQYSHVSGMHNENKHYAQTITGVCNDVKEDTLFEVGNGSFADNGDGTHTVTKRQNAFEVYRDGHAEIQKVGSSGNSVVTRAHVAAVETAVNNTINAVDSTLKTALSNKSNATNLSNGGMGTTNHELYPFQNAQGGKDSSAAYDGDFVFGTGLENTYENQAVFGRWNDNTNWTDPRPLLMVGNGKSNTERSNAFEVYADGHAEVQTMGETDNSVATKQYVDSNGGTKLYKHNIRSPGTIGITVVIINTSSTNVSGHYSSVAEMPFICGYITDYPEYGTSMKQPILCKYGPVFYVFDRSTSTFTSYQVTETITDTVEAL